MNDLDFIERKKHTSTEAELIATNAIGAQNVYIINNIKSQQYISKSSQSAYLFDLERIELEKELKESDDYTKEILSQANSNYNSRLDYSIQNDFVEVDLCSENITQKENIWNGSVVKTCYPDYYNNNYKFCLYDIYLKIVKTTGEFTKKDLLKFVDFKIKICLIEQSTFEKDFFTMCFLELIENHDILIEPNIIYLKAITFENLIYGIPNYFLIGGGLKIQSTGLDAKTHSEYKIDLIYSGKNISNIKPVHLENDGFEQLVISSQTYKYNKKISSKDKIEIKFEHAVSLIMFFLYNDDIETDELVNTNIDAVGLGLNKEWFI